MNFLIREKVSAARIDTNGNKKHNTVYRVQNPFPILESDDVFYKTDITEK